MNAVAPQPIRPSGWWYLVPVAIAVVAWIVGVRLLIGGFTDSRDVFFDANLAAPGQDQALTISEPGSYTIAYVGPSLVRSTSEQEQLAQDLRISVVDAGTGEALALQPYEGLNDIEEDGQQYVPLLTVRFDDPGDYVLRSSSLAVTDPRESGLVVHESPFRKLRDGLVRGAAVAVVGTLIAILVAVILARTRGRAKRARPPQVPRPPIGWGPPGGGTGWGQRPGYVPPTDPRYGSFPGAGYGSRVG